MSAFNRTTVKSGPAILTWNGATIYFKNGLTIEEQRADFAVEVDTFTGKDMRVEDRMATLKGVPSGQWKDLAILFPWLSSAPGARLHSASDLAAVVHFLDGDKFTYHNAALAQMPSLTFSPTKTLLGEIVLECRTKNNVLASVADSFVTRTNVAFDDTSFSFADILTQAYTLNWGASPWNDFHTVDGVVISSKLSWREIVADSIGVVDKMLTALEVSASFTPIGMTQAGIDAKLALQDDASAVRGASLSALADTFSLTGTGVYVELRSAFLRMESITAGRDKERHGKMEAVATQGISGGAAIAQLLVATAD